MLHLSFSEHAIWLKEDKERVGVHSFHPSALVPGGAAIRLDREIFYTSQSLVTCKMESTLYRERPAGGLPGGHSGELLGGHSGGFPGGYSGGLPGGFSGGHPGGPQQWGSGAQ